MTTDLNLQLSLGHRQKENPGVDEMDVLYLDWLYFSFYQRRGYLSNYRKNGIWLSNAVLSVIANKSSHTAVKTAALFCRRCLRR